MDFLKRTREKPLTERKKMVWILSIASLVVIILAWLAFFNEWKLPKMDISQSPELKELVDDAKNSTSLFQEQISSLQETTAEINQAATDQVQKENQRNSFTKKNVQVSLINWRQDGDHGFVNVGLNNLSETAVSFKNFVLRQGYEEVFAPLEEKLESQQKKEMEIDFLLLKDLPVTAFEIRDVFFSEEGSWNYLFVINDKAEISPEASPALADTNPAETEPAAEEPGPSPIEIIE